jgi:predicted DNA-binding WGR domain protein
LSPRSVPWNKARPSPGARYPIPRGQSPRHHQNTAPPSVPPPCHILLSNKINPGQCQDNAHRAARPIIILNRFCPIDSKLSLDRIDQRSDHHGMITQHYKIYFERRDPNRNMARYYTMEIAPDLFGQVCLTRSWGRIGKRGQLKQHRFAEERDAVGLFLEILRKKRHRGYRPPPPVGCPGSMTQREAGQALTSEMSG